MFILKKYEKIISIIIALLFVFGTVVSIYHVGIEQGIFKESLVCDLVKAEMNNITPSEILKELEKKTVSCKVVTFRFLGFSLATFNTIISFILSAIMIVNIKNYGKN
jgi:disulfide bond formation protein DsbB